MKKLIVLLVLLFATPAFADYTLDLKNDGGTIIKTYTITANQVTHLQKVATRNSVTILTLFENTIKGLVSSAKSENAITWLRANEAYIEEQSRQ